MSEGERNCLVQSFLPPLYVDAGVSLLSLCALAQRLFRDTGSVRDSWSTVDPTAQLEPALALRKGDLGSNPFPQLN